MSKTKKKKSKDHYVAVRLPDDIMSALQHKMDLVQEDMSTVVRMILREQLGREKLL